MRWGMDFNAEKILNQKKGPILGVLLLGMQMVVWTVGFGTVWFEFSWSSMQWVFVYHHCLHFN